jgi:hypothetical protein
MRKENETADGRRWTQIPAAASEPVYHAANFQAGVTEIEQQRQAQPRRPQVIYALCSVNAIQSFHCFQFNDNSSFNHKVGSVIAHDDTIIPNFGRILLRNAEAILPKLVCERILIDPLEKPSSQPIQYCKCTPDNAFRNSVQHVFICVHLRPSAVPFSSLNGTAHSLSSSL